MCKHIGQIPQSESMHTFMPIQSRDKNSLVCFVENPPPSFWLNQPVVNVVMSFSARSGLLQTVQMLVRLNVFLKLGGLECAGVLCQHQ